MWRIVGRYNGGKWETIDEASDWLESQYMLKEYALAFGDGWELMVINI